MAQQPQVVEEDEINLSDFVPQAGLQEPQPIQVQDRGAPRAVNANAVGNEAPAPRPLNVEPVRISLTFYF